ncbi:hypothetical protein J437_LFUL010761, partial [Ladona fulva]
MEISKNDRLMQKLRSSSPSVVYQALIEIRTKEVNSANGVAFLRKSGALKYFVKFLQKPNEKILDVTLSILGNCCLENETRLELWRLGAVGPIVRILEGVGKDSIQGRTCRVLGNLAQLPDVAADICHEGAVPAIVGILGATSENNSNSSTENNASESTRQMAVRALRVLAVNPEYRSEILNKGGARAVAELLSSSNEELQKAAIKALVTLTQQCSEECANQVQGDDTILEKLVSFVWDPNIADDPAKKKQLSSTLTEGALACLANLAHIPEVRPKLGNAGAVCALINQLRHVTSLEFCDEWKLRELVSTLCLFSRESVNRMKLRDHGGLNQLLILLKDDRHGPVAAALCNFVYDELGFRQLIDCGLIPICADRLRDVIFPKLRENGRSHAFVSVKNENSLKKKQYFGNYLKGQKSSNYSISNQSAAVDDSIQNVSNLNLDQKLNGPFDESAKRLLKSPLKSSMQKTFRISSPSYQAVRHEQEGQKCSSPPSNSSPALFAGGSWTHFSSDCHPPSSSAVGCALWPGNSASFSLNALFQSQGSMSPTSVSFASSQFQDGLMSPEASSCCSGGSSSSCTSGYASSPRSDLSDAPSPSSGYSTTATNDSEEIYSPVYDDGSDDSGEDDLNLKKTFRISSPSYQAVRHEQEGQKCSSPPSNSSPALFAGGSWTHFSSDCHPPSSSAVGCALWPGNSASFSLNALFQSQGSMSPTSVSFASSQFQDGLMSPEASSCCSGGSSSSCTSGYASSPRSDLSDAPSPSSGYSTTATNDSEEIYSPVYDDGSDDSGEDDLNLK